MPTPRTTTPAAAVTLAIVILGGAVLAACSSDDAGSPSSGSSPLPTFTRTKPASTGASCDDGTGDIIDDASAATEGTLREPAGIDLVRVEANLEGDLLVVEAVTVGAWGSATNPALSIVQGDPMSLPDRSWELRFLSETGSWRAEVITFPTAPGQQQKNKSLSAPVQVAGNTLTASIPAADLPVIGTTQWLFGSSAGIADATRLIDDCLPFLKGPGTSVPGTSVGAGTVVDVPTTVPITGKVGTAVLAPDGSEVTVRKIEDPARPNRPGFDLEAFPSTHLMGIEVSVCARGRVVEKVGEQRFTVFVQGQTVGFTVWPAPIHPYEPRFTKREDGTTATVQDTPSTTLLPPPVNLVAGQCELGWITFQIPDRLPVAKVVYDASTTGVGPFVSIEP